MPKTSLLPFERQLIDRLDKILRLLMFQVIEDKSVTEAARALKSLGLDNQTIAEVLNTTPATIRTVTANLPRRGSASRR